MECDISKPTVYYLFFSIYLFVKTNPSLAEDEWCVIDGRGGGGGWCRLKPFFFLSFVETSNFEAVQHLFRCVINSYISSMQNDYWLRAQSTCSFRSYIRCRYVIHRYPAIDIQKQKSSNFSSPVFFICHCEYQQCVKNVTQCIYISLNHQFEGDPPPTSAVLHIPQNPHRHLVHHDYHHVWNCKLNWIRADASRDMWDVIFSMQTRINYLRGGCHLWDGLAKLGSIKRRNFNEDEQSRDEQLVESRVVQVVTQSKHQ